MRARTLNDIIRQWTDAKVLVVMQVAGSDAGVDAGKCIGSAKRIARQQSCTGNSAERNQHYAS
jgi:hypothetical protein